MILYLTRLLSGHEYCGISITDLLFRRGSFLAAGKPVWEFASRLLQHESRGGVGWSGSSWWSHFRVSSKSPRSAWWPGNDSNDITLMVPHYFPQVHFILTLFINIWVCCRRSDLPVTKQLISILRVYIWDKKVRWICTFLCLLYCWGKIPHCSSKRGWADPIARLDVLEKGKSVALEGIQTLDYPILSLVTTLVTPSPVHGTALLNITITINAHYTFQYNCIIFRHVNKIVIDPVPKDNAVVWKCLVCLY